VFHWTHAPSCSKATSLLKGMAVGRAYVLSIPYTIHTVKPKTTQNITHEIKIFQQSLHLLRKELKATQYSFQPTMIQSVFSIFETYQHILDEDVLENDVLLGIQSGLSASYALKRVVDGYLKQFECINDPYLKERGDDIEDLANQLLYFLDQKKPQKKDNSQPIIIIVETLSTHILTHSHLNICGIISLKDSKTSHAAILIKALNIPTLMGFFIDFPIIQLHQRSIILDSKKKQLFIDPSKHLRIYYEKKTIKYRALQNKIYSNQSKKQSLSAQKNRTKDGTSILLLINTPPFIDSTLHYHNNQNTSSLMASLLPSSYPCHPFLSIDGIGLFRSEMFFMQYTTWPNEMEQIKYYRRIFKLHPNQCVTLRTLDIGGDKQLPYFRYKNEKNNFFLSQRIQVSIELPHIFLTQIKAMLRASLGYPHLKIALPMIRSLDEFKKSIRLIHESIHLVKIIAQKENAVFYTPEIGIILEVPSVIFQLDDFIPYLDFLSVGTNDLIHYLMAIERHNQRDESIHYFQPAVLKALHTIFKKTQGKNIRLQVCGEMASDPLACFLLIGMGYRELSLNPTKFQRVKDTLSHFTVNEMKEMTQKLLQYPNAEEIQLYLHNRIHAQKSALFELKREMMDEAL
jgi:phosphotransferase system enzyme I (PtsP)